MTKPTCSYIEEVVNIEGLHEGVSCAKIGKELSRPKIGTGDGAQDPPNEGGGKDLGREEI